MMYQYAIEEVYWRHRIWPKDNPQPKPSLDAIVSQREIEHKVDDYLHNSQLVAEQSGSPITASELQGELDRLSGHTKQPEVLHELFAALDNDPFAIAECLARPLLAERFLAQFSGSALESSRAKSRDPVERQLSDSTGFLYSARNDVLDNASYKLAQVTVPLDCVNDTWTATSTVTAPDARQFHTALWTGSEMIIWGGGLPVTNTGARYDPATDSWTATNIANAPTARWLHTAVWTGTEMIVWGGGGNGLLNTGARYNPAADSWTATSTANTPAARNYHTAVWSGSAMIVWGGSGCGGNCQWNTGGRYNPTTDSWTATSTTNAPVARFTHSAVWTGSEMIVWGGADGIVNHTYLHTGGKYDPRADSWTPTGLANVPVGRDGFTAVWTGDEMIVWGGVDESFNPTNTGGRYNPGPDSWIATNAGSGPSPRADHTGVWTGSEMVVWGGGDQTSDFNTGGRYNAGTDSWIPTTAVNAPFARLDHAAIWTGNEMIVWGGFSGAMGSYLNTGGRYCAQPSTPIVQSAVSRKTHGNAGSFDINLPLSGTPGVECRSGNATNDYTIVVTFLANVSVSGNPQAAVTSGIGSIGTGGISDGGQVTIAGNVVTIPLTNVANAQTINVTLNNVNGSTNVTIPMRILIGDTNSNGVVSASDISQTKARAGQVLNSTNFRSDVDANGAINATDISMVKASVGTGLP